MARESERTVQQSVLDRLIDRDPQHGDGAPPTWERSVDKLKRSLLHDLGALLNTRRIAEPAPDSFPEVQRSVYHFGLPDITSLSGDSETVRRRLLRQIEECLHLFEPRLTGVRITPVETEEESRRKLHFVIEAVLCMEPNPERVAFDTVLEISSGKFLVSGSRHA